MDRESDVSKHLARPILTTLRIAGVFVVTTMPAFLTGASAVFLREDLGFDEAALGAAISTFFLTFALTTTMSGRIAERIGGGRALSMAAFGSAAVLLGIALFARSYSHLILFLALGGLVNGLSEPATNLALARVPATRQALMFGIKQAAIPVATLLSGASVPMIALVFGWRWAFAAGALLAVLFGVLMPSQLARAQSVSGRGTKLRSGDVSAAPLVAMAIAMGFGTAGAVSLGSFTVESAVAAGLEVGQAGWLLVVGSVAGILMRLAIGWLADLLRGTALYFVSGLLALGAVGYLMVASGSTGLLPLGTLIAYAFGWGWTGLLMYAIVRLNPNAPAAASAIVLTGAAGGAALGPVIFGGLVSTFSYAAAWSTMGAASFSSAILLLGARFWVLRQRRALDALHEEA